MGVNLTIIPAYGGDQDFSLSILECERNIDLFTKVRAAQDLCGRDVSRRGIKAYIGDKYSNHDTDGYGDVLRSIRAEDLRAIEPPAHNRTNRAIWAYLAELDVDHECYLYWH